MIIEDGVLISVRNSEIVNGTIVIPDKVTKIGDKAFQGCKNLINIHIPDSVTQIGNNAFQQCKNLINIDLPKWLTQIKYATFWGCENLRSISIPKGVNRIESGAFCGCENLTSIDIPEGVTQIEGETFFCCENLRSINIPQNVTQIGNNAFSNCKNLTSVNIPQSVANIGINAFFGCEKLTDVNIPEGVSQIGNSAFQECKAITSIRIPQSVTNIGNNVFKGCEISNISFPQNVTKKVKENLYNALYEANPQETKKFLFGEDLERIERIKSKAYFGNIVRDEEYSEEHEEEYDEWYYEEYDEEDDVETNVEYDEKLMDIFYFRMLNSIGLDEIEKMVEIPSLTKEEIQKYSLEKDEAFLELYDTRYKISGDLGITLKLLKQLQLSKKVQDASEKNNLEIRIFKKLNEKLEEGYNGTLTNLVLQILDEQQIVIEPEFVKKIEELEKSINKALVKENLSKVGIKIEEALRTPNEQYPEAIVPMQISPIKAMIEDTITNLFKEIGYIDYETLKNMLEVKISHAHAPYIVQKKIK